MKIQTTKFVCDRCQKTEEAVQLEGKNPYPYPNWMYLYNMNWKAAQGDNEKPEQDEMKDKHFCSLMCMHQFVVDAMQKSREES